MGGTSTGESEGTSTDVETSGAESTSSSTSTTAGQTESSGPTTGVPLPEGCQDHLALEVSALSVSTEGPSWDAGESVTVNVSLFNPAAVDNTSYPSVFVEADVDGVATQLPIFTWFAIFAGQTHEASLVFTSAASIRSGTEVEFTAYVATLEDACPGIGTISATATVQ